MNTLKYFYEISKIPRETGNESHIANYLCGFAKERVYIDSVNRSDLFLKNFLIKFRDFM